MLHAVLFFVLEQDLLCPKFGDLEPITTVLSAGLYILILEFGITCAVSSLNGVHKVKGVMRFSKTTMLLSTYYSA